MQFPQFSSCGPLIIIVCCLSLNDAVPFLSHPSGQVRSTTSSQAKTKTAKTTPVALKTHRDSVKIFNRDNNDSEIDSNEDNSSYKSKQIYPENSEMLQNEEEVPEKCMYDGESQSNARSIPSNTSFIQPDEDFKMSGDAEAKKTSSVHIGEDVALCWIETTTIKEDPQFDPPKRLVIREFTISFENSASIPDSYLECSKLKGEIAIGDKDTVSESALHEVIDKNTKRSRDINYTHVNHIGRIIVRQHKKIKCGVGVVVSKDIFEWPDGTDNPKKRVEIKVGPSICDLNAMSDDKPGQCATESVPKSPQVDHSQLSSSDCTSGELCGILASCKNGDCHKIVTDSPCENDDCSTESLSEETTLTNDLSSSNEVSSTEVTGSTTTIKSTVNKSSSPLSHKPERDEADPCSENDPDCLSSKKKTVQPESDFKKSGNCLGEDCGEISFDGSTREVSCDESEDASCLCSGENCASQEQSTSSTESSAQMTTETNEFCENNSCSMNGSKEKEVMEVEDKQTDTTTVSPVHGTNGRTTESSVEPSIDGYSSEKDSRCDGDSGSCSVSSQSNSNEDMKDIEKTSTKSFENDSNNGPSAEENGETEITDVTDVSRETGTASRTEIVRPCNGSEPEGCSTVIPDDTNISGNVPNEIEEAITYELVSDSKENERSSSCSESDEGCQFADSSNEFVPSLNPLNIMTEFPPKVSNTKTILPTSESTGIETNRFDDAVTETPIIKIYEETDAIQARTEATGSITLSDEESSDKGSLMKCSADSKESGLCEKKIDTRSSERTDNKIIYSSPGETSLPLQSCNSSGNCESNDETSISDEMHQATLINATERTQTATICDESNKNCESPSPSNNSTEDCDDSLTDCTNKSTSSVPRSCVSASGSCLSETTATEITATTQSTTKELEHFSLVNNSISSTAETRRSLATTTPLSFPVKRHHRLALRIKLLLEHIDENKEKEPLVQVERHLLLNEKPNEHGNNSLTMQLQSLNNSMNLETLKALLNCTTLEKLSEDVINLDKLSKDVIELKEVGQKTEGNVSFRQKEVVLPVEDSVSQADDDTGYNSNDRSGENLSPRRKREISIPLNSTTESKNNTDSVEEKTILESLPGVKKDFQNGMDHVFSRISKELDDSAIGTSNKTTESSSSKILKMLSDPSDTRIHSKNPRTSEIDRIVSVRQLQNPLNGEEIERWSKERFFSAPDGRRIRSLTEFRILRNHGDDS